MPGNMGEQLRLERRLVLQGLFHGSMLQRWGAHILRTLPQEWQEWALMKPVRASAEIRLGTW
jgi:hypothetical protein